MAIRRTAKTAMGIGLSLGGRVYAAILSRILDSSRNENELSGRWNRERGSPKLRMEG